MKMKKYRAIPEIIDAWRFSVNKFNAGDIPDELKNLKAVLRKHDEDCFRIDLPHGVLILEDGDYIIKDSCGHLDVVEQYDFDSLYEELEQENQK